MPACLFDDGQIIMAEGGIWGANCDIVVQVVKKWLSSVLFYDPLEGTVKMNRADRKPKGRTLSTRISLSHCIASRCLPSEWTGTLR